MNIRHIFFDLDNTLWDHRKNAYLTLKTIFEREKIKEKYHLNFEDFHKEYFTINEHLWAQIRDGKIDKPYLRKHRFYDSFLFFGIDNMELSQYFESHFLDEILAYNHLVEGCLEVLDYLKTKNYRLHILSNGFHEVTHRKVNESGISQYFDTVTSADEINIRKPQPEIFQWTIDKAEAKIEESIMIGDDWIADIEGGLSFGMEVVFFDVFNDDLYQEKVRTIKKLTDLKEIL
ncbi:YjjG family noncanonical pyrimidine nucleotidase [Amniculibacterium sp. G2-70]|uniref:YjjG family noncanonical pyrimidine nucleotidase n=1 Tax=Amniculibacterium sp. G2-70 TaxID=2767188 RepID=UPI0016548DA3|nr:YjjG family noncanonical pyrimidine nucleotidase [Amniculibacterium sp. G2-70]